MGTTFTTMVRGKGGRGAAEAIQRANTLVLQNVPAEEIVESLKRVAGDPQTLRQAAQLLDRYDSFPANRCRELLLAAADDSPIPAVSDELRIVEEEQRLLLQMDLSDAFSLLAARLPALLEFERRAREGVPPAELSRIGRLAARSADPKLRAMGTVEVLVRESTRLVGPSSHQRDSLLASPAAEAVVRRHLGRLVGLLPPD